MFISEVRRMLIVITILSCVCVFEVGGCVSGMHRVGFLFQFGCGHGCGGGGGGGGGGYGVWVCGWVGGWVG